MREPDQAYKYANMLLDDHNRDPDSGECVLARQYIIVLEALRHVASSANIQVMSLPESMSLKPFTDE